MIPQDCFLTQPHVAPQLHLWAETGCRSGRGISLIEGIVEVSSSPVPNGEILMSSCNRESVLTRITDTPLNL